MFSWRSVRREEEFNQKNDIYSKNKSKSEPVLSNNNFNYDKISIHIL